jgi:hypothetical protein
VGLDLEYKDSPVRPSTTPGGARRNLEEYQRKRQDARELERKDAPASQKSAALRELERLRREFGYE